MRIHTTSRAVQGLPPAYLANGFVGLRVGQIPLPGGSALVNGFVGVSAEKGSEEYAQAPYPVGADLCVDGVWLSEHPECAEFLTQEYDFSCGELRSRFAFRVGSAVAEVAVVTFCSRTQPTLVLQEIAVTVNQPCRLIVQAHLEHRGLEGRLAYRCMPARHQDGIIRWESRGGVSSLGVAYWSEFICDDPVERRRNDYGHEEDIELTQYQVAAAAGKRYVLRQVGACVPSLLHGEPHWHAARMVRAGAWSGFAELRAGNHAAWAELWQGRVILHGADPRWQDIADAAFFYLHSSIHLDLMIAETLRGLIPLDDTVLTADLAAHPEPSTNQKHAPPFAVTRLVELVLGQDATLLDGIGAVHALTLLGLLGRDFSKWPTAQHFTSHLTLAPVVKISGGKRLSSRTHPGSHPAAAIFKQAAAAVTTMDTALGAFYRRLAVRIGRGKALTATARKIAIQYYHLVKEGRVYVDIGAQADEERYHRRQIALLTKRAAKLGFRLAAAE